MIECPVCGFNPNPVETPATEAELKHRRLLSIFAKNLQNSWWLTQPDHVCKWLKAMGVYPKSLLDAGCGDARWLPGIISCWPDVDYLGVDKISEHIEINRENFPEYKFHHGDISEVSERVSDLVLIGGAFNPLMSEDKQAAFIEAVKSARPRYIACLFDLNETGTQPDFMPYRMKQWIAVPHDFQGPRQKNVVWLYE